MNILFVYERKIIPSFGGLERVTSLLAQEFRRRGNSVFFLSVGPPEWNLSESEEDFPQEYIAAGDSDFTKRFEDYLNRHNIERVIFQGHHHDVMKALQCSPDSLGRYSVFHYQPFPLVGKERLIKRNTPFRDLKLKGKVLKVLAQTSPAFFRSLYLRKMGVRFEKMQNHSDRLVLLSDSLKARMEQYFYRLNPEKLYAINNPLTFTPGDYNVSEKENAVLVVARFNNPQKNLTGFIDAWLLFSRRHPDWKAVMVGDGEHRDLVEKYARKKKAQNIWFEGHRKNVEDYFRRAKIFCMTSAYEGWGMVLTEAMAYGCVPVVYESYESVKDIITSGEDGFLVRPFDKKAMANKLGELANDEDLRLRLARNGERKIRKFEVSGIADKWMELFRKTEEG